jgi:hypothetical protein
LVVIATLLCAYAACWGPTTRKGVHDVEATFERSQEKLHPIARKGAIQVVGCAPLIVGVDDEVSLYSTPSGGSRPLELAHREYYFWFFGYVAKLPYEREVPLQQ